MRRPRRKKVPRAGSTAIVTIEGEEVRATLPEGATASMTVADLCAHMQPGVPDSRGTVLPDGVKCVHPTRGGCILVHQTPPSVHNFRWITPDSEVPYGPKAVYREVRLALPYLIVLAIFDVVRGDLPCLSRRNECFFVNQPLDKQGFDTELCYPALLNCSRFPAEPGNPLSWICTENLHRGPVASQRTLNGTLRVGLRILLHHLLETGFNLSSEHHELNSWFSESVAAGIDSRIDSVEAWEEASESDPLFVLDVPWLPTGLSLQGVFDRVDAACGRDTRFSSSEDIARVVLSTRPQQLSL